MMTKMITMLSMSKINMNSNRSKILPLAWIIIELLSEVHSEWTK